MKILVNNIRSFVILILFLFFYLAVVINLYFIQIRQAHFFKELGEKQYNITMQTYPARGMIFDRTGKLLTINKDIISAFILPKELVDSSKLYAFLKKEFPQAYERLSLYEKKSFMFIKRNLSEQEVLKINDDLLFDIHFLKESSRFYPYETLGSIVGITDIDNNGLFGIEQQYNIQLQGTPTTYKLKKDAKQKHFYFSKEIYQSGIEPESVTLTVDADLQFKLQMVLDDTIELCQAKEAAAVVLDPVTGEIYAMISSPSFNPNDLKNIDLESTKNRPVSECFETGSVVKIFAAIASLEEKVTTLDEIIDCENTKETKLCGLRIRTVHPNGKIPFIDVIKYSNNIGTVKVTRRLGTELYRYYKLLGLGEYTGSHISGEQKGFVNHPSNWSAYSIQSLSYGYEITTNLLQLARAFSTIVNGGYLVTPTIIKTGKVEKMGPVISQATIHDMQKILQETIQEGTGKRANIKGYKILGKTGTSNLLKDGLYDEEKHLYTFTGAIDQDDYKRVIVAYVKESKNVTYASVVAAPLFRKLAETILLHDRKFVEQ